MLPSWASEKAEQEREWLVSKRGREGWSEDEGEREEGELCNLGKERERERGREREREDESSRCLFDSWLSAASKQFGLLLGSGIVDLENQTCSVPWTILITSSMLRNHHLI